MARGATRLNIDKAGSEGIMFYSSNRNVFANSEPCMTVGDHAIVELPTGDIIDPLVRGSGSITINGKPAVRSEDKTQSGAEATGSSSVFFN